MPRLDYLHHTVKNALIKAGWVITDDPFRISLAFYDISGRILLDVNQIKLIVVDADREEITEWIS